MHGNELEAQVMELERSLAQLRVSIEGLGQELRRRQALTEPERWTPLERDRLLVRELWQERVINEREQLAERLTRLETFLASQTFRELPLQEQGLLTAQAKVMGQYLDLLTRRVDRFPPGE